MGAPVRDAMDIVSMATSQAISTETPRANLHFMDEGAADSGTGIDEMDDSESMDVHNTAHEDGRSLILKTHRFR